MEPEPKLNLGLEGFLQRTYGWGCVVLNHIAGIAAGSLIAHHYQNRDMDPNSLVTAGSLVALSLGLPTLERILGITIFKEDAFNLVYYVTGLTSAAMGFGVGLEYGNFLF